MRVSAGILAALALGLAPLAWQASRGQTFTPAFAPRLAEPWPARQGVCPQSGVVLRSSSGAAALAWVDLEGAVHAATAAGPAFADLLGVQATAAPLLACDVNSDGTEDLILATSDRQLLSFDGQRGVRLAASDWFTEPILGAPVLCLAADGSRSVAVHSLAGKVARYEARSLRVSGQETYLSGHTRGPAAAFDVNGDGDQDLIMGDDTGCLVWIDARTGQASRIRPGGEPRAPGARSGSGADAMRSGVSGYDYSGDGREDWVFQAPNGEVAVCDSRGTMLARGQFAAGDTAVAPHAPAPVLADLDLDLTPEIIVAHPGGWVYAFQTPGKVPGPLSVLWKASTDDTIQNEVALADLTGDGVSDVAVVTQSGVLSLLDGRDGSLGGRWAIGATGSPLIADLNRDGRLELAVPADSSWAILETDCPARDDNTWPTWRGDAGRRGRREPVRGWPEEWWWGAVAGLTLAAVVLFAKS